MRNLLSFACLLALVAGFAAMGREALQAAHSGTPSMGAPAIAAQRIYIDLATGELRAPTAAELAADSQRATGGLQAVQRQALPAAVVADEVHLADGTVGVRPARQALHVLVLCRQPDGSFGERCPGAGSAQ